MTSVVVAGALANKAGNGGEAWVRLSWIRGLQELGCDVTFVEQIDAGACYAGDGTASSFEDSANRAWFRAVVDEFGLSSVATLICTAPGGERQVEGCALETVHDRAADADLLVNISGHLTVPDVFRRPRTRAFVDIDPGFTQAWASSGVGGARLEGHDAYFTIAERIGQPGCPIPTAGVRWLPTRQPVVLDDWPVTRGEAGRFTTVASWRGPYGPVEIDGTTYGLKVHEFRRFIDLPARAPQTFELALAIDPSETADLERLDGNGWRLVDPAAVAGTPDRFREYVQGSGGEFSVAQGVYAHTASGWFSDRTTRYLASGKPALVQDTGFSAVLPAGTGLVPFGSIDEAIAGAASIASDYDAHCAAARAIAENWFAPGVVLAQLLDRAGVS